jgi:hypothetical protein
MQAVADDLGHHLTGCSKKVWGVSELFWGKKGEKPFVETTLHEENGGAEFGSKKPFYLLLAFDENQPPRLNAGGVALQLAEKINPQVPGMGYFLDGKVHNRWI